jgi:hypothetical protein
VSSRQEEKERRRAERQQREQAEASKVSNRRRLQLVAAAVLGIVAVGAIIAAIVSATGGGGGDSKANGPNDIASVAVPGQKITDLDAAAKAAGCTWKQYPDEGHTHIADTQTFNGYKTNPPTSGRHRITPAEDGIYSPGNSPDKNNAVHAMEHGRIEIQYKPGTPKRRIGQLETLFNEKVKGVAGFHELLFENQTKMPYDVAVTSWTRSLTCPQFNDKVFDAIRAFRERFIDKGREMVP